MATISFHLLYRFFNLPLNVVTGDSGESQPENRKTLSDLSPLITFSLQELYQCRGMVTKTMPDLLRPFSRPNEAFLVVHDRWPDMEIFSLNCGFIRIIARPLRNFSLPSFIWDICGQMRE
jgi:hypothetical protein